MESNLTQKAGACKLNTVSNSKKVDLKNGIGIKSIKSMF